MSIRASRRLGTRSALLDGGIGEARSGSVRAGVLCAFLANGAGYGAWAASVPQVKQALALSEGVLGAALLCVAVGALLAMPVAGWLGARQAPRLLTLTGIVFLLALPLPAFAGGVWPLAAALLLLGAGTGSMDVCMNARASRVEQGWGAAIMSSFHAAFSLGGLLGAGIVAASEALGAGVRGGLLTASVLLAAGVAAHALLDPRPELAGREVAGREVSGLEVTGRKARGGFSAGIVGIGVLCLLAYVSEGAVADWSGVLLQLSAGFSPPAAAGGFAAFSAGMIVARLAGDAVVRRVGPLATLRWGAALGGAGILLAVVWPGAGPLGFAMVGLGAANMAPVLFSAAGRSSAAASAGVAAVATLGYGGMLLGPPVIGALAEWVGLRLALMLVVAAMVAIAVSAGRVIR